MNLSKEIKEVIEKNLPAQTAGALNDYLKKAKEAIEVEDKLKNIEIRELALDKTILEIKLQESEKRADAITSLTETVFKNRKLVIEKSSNVPLAVEGSSGCMGGIANGMGNETETREEK